MSAPLSVLLGGVHLKLDGFVYKAAPALVFQSKVTEYTSKFNVGEPERPLNVYEDAGITFEPFQVTLLRVVVPFWSE